MGEARDTEFRTKALIEKKMKDVRAGKECRKPYLPHQTKKHREGKEVTGGR